MKLVKLVVFMLVAMLFSVSAMAVSPLGRHTLAGSMNLILANGTTATTNYNIVHDTYDLCIASKDKITVETIKDGSHAYANASTTSYIMFVDCFKTTF